MEKRRRPARVWVGGSVHANGGGGGGWVGLSRGHTPLFGSSWLFPARGVMGKWRRAASHRPITLGGPPGAIMGFGGVARNVVAGVWVWASGGGGTWKAAEVQRASPGGALSARAAVEGPSQLVRADSRGRLMRWCARAN